jgi:hypothetical protein
MATVTRSRKPVKSERKIRVAVPPSEVNPFSIVVITVGREEANYCVRPLPSDFGQAFEVEKIFVPDGNTYHIRLDGEGGSCECKGFLRWGHCRHVEGLQALRDAGKL